VVGKPHYRCSRASNSRLIVSNTHSAFLNSVLFSNPGCSLVRGMFSTRDTERTTPSAPFKERAHFLGGAATPPSKGGDFSGQHKTFCALKLTVPCPSFIIRK